MVTGRFSANSSPVTTADRSTMVMLCRRLLLSLLTFHLYTPNKNSVSTVLAMVTKITANALGPKL